MLIREANPGEGPICDELLTQLIQMESRWDENMDETFTVCDNYEHRMTEDDTLLLGPRKTARSSDFCSVSSTLLRCIKSPSLC